eukprot:scaffold112247_cov73-Attheya_sp.AAC.2
MVAGLKVATKITDFSHFTLVRLSETDRQTDKQKLVAEKIPWGSAAGLDSNKLHIYVTVTEFLVA